MEIQGPGTGGQTGIGWRWGKNLGNRNLLGFMLEASCQRAEPDASQTGGASLMGWVLQLAIETLKENKWHSHCHPPCGFS